jgi:U4/U6.U5 tri-snRNP component SNU23
MNSNNNNKGVVNVQRRTWDKSKFEALAKERLASDLTGKVEILSDGRGGEGEVVLHPIRSALQLEADARALAVGGPAVLSTSLPIEEDKSGYFTRAGVGAAGPSGSARAYLPQRDAEQLNLEARVNKRKLVTDATPTSEVGGYYCNVCLCSLRDSNAYLDHLNGTNHQRKLGFSMRVEKSTVMSVKERLKALKGTTTLTSSNSNSGSGSSRGGESEERKGDVSTSQNTTSNIADDVQDDDSSKRVKTRKIDHQKKDEEEEDPEAEAIKAALGFSGFK